MCLGDKNMTNSEILHFIIEELGKSSLSWSGDKELFELICAPLSYGNELFQQRKELKSAILSLLGDKKLDKKRFNSLANNIICGENEKTYRKELLNFLNKSGLLGDNVESLVQKIPCKKADERNYKNNFNNWKNGKTDRINRREVKRSLEKNFCFSPSLWDMSEVTVKQTIKEGVKQFVNREIKEGAKITNLFEQLRKEFNMKESITDKERETLKSIEKISHKEMMEYIATHYPLSKSHSQEFIQELIPLLFKKGYYELLLGDVIKELSPHLQESKQIKKIKARIYGSHIIGDYKKAFDILSTIEFTDDKEGIDLTTEAISNIRRHFLSDKKIAKVKREEIVDAFIAHYDNIFRYNDTFHYYPAVNLAYMRVIKFMISDEINNDLILYNTIDSIYTLCKPSILVDEKSEDREKYYYANISKLEFMLFQDTDNPLLELERFLEIEQDNISLIKLIQTQRQMQFLIDSVISVQGLDHPLLQRVQDAVEVIDDFMEFRTVS
jgi:hypothetical protein